MKNLQSKSLIYAAIILMFLSIRFSYAQQPIQTLELNKPIERQIKGGETQTFQFNDKEAEGFAYLARNQSSPVSGNDRMKERRN